MNIIIGADLCPTAASEASFTEGRTSELFGDILTITARADRFMVNLKCALTDKDTPIRKVKAQADFVVVIYHGGKEHCLYPSPRLRGIGHEMVENGANVILMQHSHCIGCLEEYKGAKILYGQGNFHFIKLYDTAPDTWHTALLAELIFTDTVELKLYPIVATECGMELARGARADEIMTAFAARGEELKDGRWREGWRAFCESVSERYLAAIGGAYREGAAEQENELFAHYLDCEAHTDVWHELCKTWHQTNKS